MTESIYSKAMRIIEERDAGYSPSEPTSPEVAVEEVSVIEEAVKTLALEEHSVDEQIASLLR